MKLADIGTKYVTAPILKKLLTMMNVRIVALVAQGLGAEGTDPEMCTAGTTGKSYKFELLAYAYATMIVGIFIALAYVLCAMQGSRRSRQDTPPRSRLDDEPEPGAEPPVPLLPRALVSVAVQTEWSQSRPPPTAPPLWLLEEAEAGARTAQRPAAKAGASTSQRPARVDWRDRRFQWIARSDVIHSQWCRALQAARSTPETRRLCQFCADIERQSAA